MAVAALLCSLVLVAVANALTHQHLETFSEAAPTALQPSFGNPSGLTFDQSNGDLLAIDLSNHTLNRFEAEGHPDDFSALGTNVIDGKRSGATNECPTVAADCDETPGNAGVLSVEEPGAAIEAQAAVAPSTAADGTAGYIYVTDAFHESLDIFEPTGKYLAQLPGAGYACGVTVDSTGTVYVGDWYGTIHKYVPTSTPGSYTNSANFASAETGIEHPCLLAAGARPVASGGSEGFIFAVNWLTGAENVAKIDASTGVTQYVVDTSSTNAGLALDPSTGHLYVAGGTEIKEYDVSGGTEALRTSTIELAGTARGVAVDQSTGNVYVTRSGEAHVEVWGPAEPGLPAVETDSEQVSEVGSAAATVEARVNPEGAPVSYHFDYVDLPSFEAEGGFASPHTLSTPERASGFENSQFHQLSETLTGLTPHTAYRWRIVVTNTAGTTYGEAAAFATRSASGGAALPDNRGYEMVSPAQKNNAEAGTPTGTGFGVVPQRAAEDGSAITFPSFTAFGEGVEGAGYPSQYLSRRGPGGWSTEPLNPEFEEGYTRDPLVGFSPDLGFAAVYNIAPALTADADREWPNLYVRDNASGALTALTTEPPTPRIWVSRNNYCLAFAGASADFSRVYFTVSGGALRPGDPEGAGIFDVNLYEWSRAQGLKLASVLPDGSSASPNGASGFGAGSGGGQGCLKPENDLLRHAVSEDGSTAIWTYAAPGGPELLARLDGTETVQLDLPNQGVPVSEAGGGEYWDASADGSKVFFTDSHRLTTDASAAGSDLYRYDFDRPEGERLTDLTANGAELALVQGVIGASDAGDVVYFVAERALTPASDENWRHEHAEAGKANLYVWQEGHGNKFVAQMAPNNGTIDPGDSSNWKMRPSEQTARVAPDGRHLAFVSERSLTGYDNRILGAPTCHRSSNGNYARSTRCPEAFVYSLRSGTVACASCDPSGARPTIAQLEVSNGAAELPLLGWPTPYAQPKQLSADGSRLVFATFNPLVPQDVNGKRDVYQWEAAGSGSCSESAAGYSALTGGCVDLISTGRSGDESYLLDASSSGDDVFLSTRQPLSWRDGDERFDVYDARVGGGEASPPSPPCEGDGCRGPGTSGGEPQGLGSAALAGSGNVAAHRNCTPLSRKAGRSARRAKHMGTRARVLAPRRPASARRLRLKARRLAHRAHRLSVHAKSCRRANRRAAR